jgi:nucleotide-binding universal stress UspA family protein
MFHNILVAVDGSAHAERALSQAIDLADSQNARLTLFSAVATPPPGAYLGGGASVAGELAQDAEKATTEIVEAAVQRVPESLPVRTIMSKDPVRAALVHEIKQGNYDLVVMGSRGRGALRSALLGSVSHYVLHHSPVPVLIVHAEDEAPSGEGPDNSTATSLQDAAGMSMLGAGT